MLLPEPAMGDPAKTSRKIGESGLGGEGIG
jgi:hypothetical protein